MWSGRLLDASGLTEMLAWTNARAHWRGGGHLKKFLARTSKPTASLPALAPSLCACKSACNTERRSRTPGLKCQARVRSGLRKILLHGSGINNGILTQVLPALQGCLLTAVSLSILCLSSASVWFLRSLLACWHYSLDSKTLIIFSLSEKKQFE